MIEFHEAREAPVRIRITGSHVRSEVTLARTTVDPMFLRRAPAGSLLIPFNVPAPEDPLQSTPREVRLHARAAHWPVGWGATFVIAENP